MKTMTSRILPAVAIFTAALTLIPATSFAKGEGRASFEQLDIDGDGTLTAAELSAYAATRFQTADTNGDGNLSSEELVAAAGARNAERVERRVARMINRRDENDDGVLSAAELAPSEDRIAKRFERLDADSNGSISAEEFEAASKGHRGKRSGHSGHGDKKRGE